MRYIINTGFHIYRVNVLAKPMSVGGEGSIYAFNMQEYGDCIMKIYRTPEKALAKRDKILYMIKNPPVSPHPNIRFCWPLFAVEEETTGRFCGFVMKRAFENSHDLTILEFFSPTKTIAELFPDDEDRGWHNKFELKTNLGIRNRLKILYNWVSAVEALHATGRFILVDIKPENILVTPTGKVSMIDMDSCQVAENGVLMFDCNALTPGYFPPDAEARKRNKRPLDYTCDSFAMGCCIYSILTGTHPFSNTRLLAPYNTEDYSTLGARVRAGLYHDGEKGRYVQRIATFDLHANASRLSLQLNQLFRAAFVGTNRPSMNQWRKALKNELSNF